MSSFTTALVAICLMLPLACTKSLAVDHTRSVGEPYPLAGKRMVFTNWFYVRPGQIDWLNDEGKSVYGNQEPIGPTEAHFQNYDAPYGIRLIAEPAQRGEPVLQREMPWEKMGIHGTALIHNSGKYRLWGGSQKSAEEKFFCYFESTDGISWTRPELGLVEFAGNKKNNLFQFPGSYVFIDPIAPPEERYKALWAARTDPKIIEEYKKRGRPISVFGAEEDPGRFHSIRAAVSPDGFTWTELVDPISVEVSDTQIVAYYDEILKKYVMFTRAQLLGPRAEGQPRPEGRMHDFVGRRAIGRSESSNFREFPLSELIIQTEADRLPTDTYYTNCKTAIPGAPDHHLLFPTIYHQSDDTTSIEVYSSNDTKVWTRLPGSPVFRTADAGQWDGGSVFAHPQLVELPDGTWALPYTGYVYPHKYPRGAWGYDWGLAKWPKGRLIALEAPEQGAFTTVAFIVPGKTLLINAVTQRAGSIRVEACDLHGTPIAGRTFADAKPIVGDQYRTVVRWKQASDLGVEAGQPVILRFKLDRARIYGLDFE